MGRWYGTTAQGSLACYKPPPDRFQHFSETDVRPQPSELKRQAAQHAARGVVNLPLRSCLLGSWFRRPAEYSVSRALFKRSIDSERLLLSLLFSVRSLSCYCPSAFVRSRRRRRGDENLSQCHRRRESSRPGHPRRRDFRPY